MMEIYEPLCGENIAKTANRMAAIAKKTGDTVTATFNEITLTADPDMEASRIVQFFQAEMDRRAKAYRESPAGKRAERERIEQQRRAKAAEAEGIKPFAILDQVAWQSWLDANTDPYGAATMRYAARWANLMEERMRDGATVADVAEKASHDADLEGISGAMYGFAKGMLAKAWQYGDALGRSR